MADSNYRVHFNMKEKTQCIDFSIPNSKITEKTKTETAHSLIKEKHPDYSGKTIIISKVDVF
jgi:hypothetical protein